MGMAASQARLLTITARMHDVEYKAQSIQNAKIQLATQSDQVYKEYCDALNASSLTITDSNKNIMTANFNNMCGINAVETGNKYALRNSSNKLIVSDDIEEGYHDFISKGGTDPYLFAIWMMNGEETDLTEMEEEFTGKDGIEEGIASTTSNLSDKPEDLRKILSDASTAAGTTFESYEELENYLSSMNTSDTAYDNMKKYLDNYKETNNYYRYTLYQQNSETIFEKAGYDKIDYNQDNFNYYSEIFKEIQAAGDCVSIDDYNGIAGDAANDSDWLKNMIECGKITVDIVNFDKKTGEVSFNGTSPSSDSYLSYTTTSTIDKTALAKAEAEYEHKTKQINQKDKKFDMDLSKLDTERTALKTEYESVKKVITDNIERTFGIFS